MATSNNPIEVKLLPNRKLIDMNIESYRLSLNSPSSSRIKLSDGAYQVDISKQNFSLDLMEILKNHNHLILDPWNDQNVYYVDSNACVRRFHISSETNIESSRLVFSFGSDFVVTSNVLPPTLCFPSPTLCVACDGCGSMYVIETGCRREQTTDVWQIVYFNEVSKCQSMLMHTVLKVLDDVQSLHVLLLKFPERDLKTTNNENKEIDIDWITIVKRGEDEEFDLHTTKTFKGRSIPYYCVLSSDCSRLHIASSSLFKFQCSLTGNSGSDANMFEDEESMDTTDSPPYKWNQSNEFINIFFPLPSDATSYSVAYNLTSKHLSVGFRYPLNDHLKVLLEGELHMDADPCWSDWMKCDGNLEVKIKKLVPGKTWMNIIEGDYSENMEISSEDVAGMQNQMEELTMKPLDMNSLIGKAPKASKLEEKDCSDQFSASLSSFEYSTGSLTHLANINNHQWFFNCVLDPLECPSLALRHKSNLILWHPMDIPEDFQTNNMWKHVATFDALGDVHTSNKNLKFCACAPNTSYAAFSEKNLRVYIYRQPSPLSTSLHNCVSGQRIKKVAIQQVASLGTYDDIIGLQVTNQCVYVLTTQELVIFKMAVDEMT